MNDYLLNNKLIMPSTNSLITKSNYPQCAGCEKIINERYLLKAIDKLWHEDCLKCSCCDCRLGEVGSSLYIKANLILCRRDYLRLFGNTGICSACSKTIPAFEMVMRARGHNYHLECFACQKCGQRFCVGDRFYLFENRILCEFDYEDLINRQGTYSNSLEKLKKQTENIEYNNKTLNNNPNNFNSTNNNNSNNSNNNNNANINSNNNTLPLCNR